MDYTSKESIKQVLVDYDYTQLIQTFNYVTKCKGSLVNLLNNRLFQTKETVKLLEHFRMIEDCIYELLYKNNNN